MSLRVGIIGFGRIGNEHAGWLRRAKNAEPIAADDVTPERRAKAKSQGLKTYEHIDEMLADRQIDAILVSTPTAMHFDHAEAALRAGKHLMVEKPMTLDLLHAEKLVELAKQNGRVISVFHNRRWDIDYLTVKSAIDSGLFGKVINIESRLGQWSSCVGPAAREWHPSWRNEASYGGGGLYDWGSHFVDQIWQLMLPARPVRVFAQLRGNVWSKDCDDFARVCIDFDNGAVAMVEINTTTTKPLPRWQIDGTGGSGSAPCDLEFDTQKWAQLQFQPAGGSEVRAVRVPPRGLTEPQIWEQFAAACLGEADRPAVAVESVLITMGLLDAARESSRKGVAIPL
jgi:predicted dehydrogenase